MPRLISGQPAFTYETMSLARQIAFLAALKIHPSFASAVGPGP